MRSNMWRMLRAWVGVACLLIAGTAAGELLPEQLENMGNDAVNAGNCGLAIDYYEQFVQQRTDDAKVWYNLGYCYAEQGRHAEEVTAYTKALEIDPHYAKALKSLMYAHHDLGNWADVVKVGERRKILDPAGFEDWVYMSHAYFKLAQTQTSLDTKSGILRLSLDASDRCIRQTPDQKMCWYNNGLANEQLGNLDVAISKYRKAIELDPDYLKAMYALAYMYELEGETEAELALWERYIPLASQDPQWNDHVAYGQTRVTALQRSSNP